MKRVFLPAILTILFCAGLAWASMELTSARVYFKQHDWAHALQFYNQAIQKEPDNLEAYEERGEVYHVLASEAGSLDIAKQVATDKEHPQGEMIDRMLADFKQATTARKPADDATVKRMKGKIDKILEPSWEHFYFEALREDSSYTKAKETGVKDPDPKTHLFTALNDLDMAIKMMPDKWNAYGFKAQMMTKLDSTAASEASWRAAIKVIEATDKSKLDDKVRKQYEDGESIAREALLVDEYNLGQYPDVLTTADQILKTDTTNINAIQLKANVLAKMASDTTLPAARRDSMKTVAISALSKAQASRPNDPDICYTKGQFELQLADTTAAMNTFNECLKMNDKDKDILFILGVIYLEGGSHVNTELARDTFKKIIDIDPTNGPAMINYGVSLVRLNDTKTGAEWIKKGKEQQGKK